MEKYLVVIEKAENNYSAFCPDLPGCITVGDTVEETITHIKEAIALYMEAIADHGELIPIPKGLRYHVDHGIFNDKEIGEEYYIAQVEIDLSRIAA
jgi:predicted RNase H-like HicB family nuclease